MGLSWVGDIGKGDHTRAIKSGNYRGSSDLRRKAAGAFARVSSARVIRARRCAGQKILAITISWAERCSLTQQLLPGQLYYLIITDTKLEAIYEGPLTELSGAYTRTYTLSTLFFARIYARLITLRCIHARVCYYYYYWVIGNVILIRSQAPIKFLAHMYIDTYTYTCGWQHERERYTWAHVCISSAPLYARMWGSEYTHKDIR